VGKRDAQLGKAPHALVGVNEFENAFPEKHAPRHKPQQERGSGPIRRRMGQPRDQLVHDCSLHGIERERTNFIPARKDISRHCDSRWQLTARISPDAHPRDVFVFVAEKKQPLRAHPFDFFLSKRWETTKAKN
jgi:hypothetical protein